MRRIAYAYDAAVPGRTAAILQILRTGAAMAAESARFTLYSGPLEGDTPAALARLGVRPEAGLAIEPIFPLRPRHEMLRCPVRHLALARLARRLSGQVDGLIVRGPTARAAAALAWPAPLVVEMHRLEWVAANEARAGRRLGHYVPPLTPAIERLRQAEARTLAAAAGLIFLNSACAEAARASLGPFRAPVVFAPSGISAPPPSAPGGADPSTRPYDLVFLGKAERRKGLPLAIAMLPHLEGVRLLVLGGGEDLDEARRQAADAGVADRVTFAGHVAPAEIPARLQEARVGLCPLPGDLDSVSASYSSPMKLMDYLAAGLSVVASDLPSIRVAVGQCAAVRLVPAEDATAHAAAAAALLDDSGGAGARVRSARQVVAARDWPVRAREILYLFDEIDAGTR